MMQLTELLCGREIRLYTIPKDTFKTDYLFITFELPLTEKTAAEYALLPSVLARGSEHYPTMRDFARELDTLYNAGIGCRTGKCGESYFVMFSLRCLEEMCVPGGEDLFAGTAAVYKDMLLHPILEQGHFSAAYTEREKKNLIDAIRAQINNKSGYALARLEREMCRGEAFGIPGRGEVEYVSAVTPEELYAAYLDMLAHAPVSCYYVGKLPPEAVREKLTPLFSELESFRAEPFYKPQTTVLRRAVHPPHTVEEEQPAKQSRLCIGYRTGSVLADGDYYRFALFNELFGGSAVSKLFSDVREERGLCYDCASFPEAQKGLMFVSCGISAADRDEAKSAIDAQLDAIRHGDITDAEFAAAKKSLAAGYREIEDSAASLAFWYANRLHAGIATSPGEAAAQAEDCTKEDVIACAARVTEDTVYFMRGTQDTGDEDDDCREGDGYDED
ncbi:MAG: EF-P 5-aminopentanol modification-associated protein YfmF [Eubacteriales bacterium]